jgi:hypothetical protein
MAFLKRCSVAYRSALAAVLMLCGSLSAQPPEAGENALKAAFLYNFTKFVDWPPSAFAQSDSAFHVCVSADERFGREIETMLQGEQVHGRPVRLLISKIPDPSRACHLLYLGIGDSERAGQVLSALKERPVLTVGEGSRFMEQGGMIAFVIDANHVKFDINKGVLDRAGLGISSKLLRVARHVQREPVR